MKTPEQNLANQERERRKHPDVAGRSFLRDHGLSLVLAAAFLALLAGQFFAGHREYNDEREDRGLAPVELAAYAGSSHFWEATGENWESEFLQMCAYVLLTTFLFQRGSSESKKLSKENPVDEDARAHSADPDAPWPVRRGGWVLRLYENSLSLALLALFLLSAGLHALGGQRLFNEERLAQGERALSLGGYLASSRFWFESLQNWQSEFLAVLAIVVLSIFLRQRGSPESKPVAAPHWKTEE